MQFLSVSVLTYYDVHKPVTLACDLSKSGLEAAILQDQLPIAYTSRALTDNKMKIGSKLKKKYGIALNFITTFMEKTVTVQTDHKLLKSIFKKLISK